MSDAPTERSGAQAPADAAGEPPPRAPGAYLARPLWQRFALSLFVAAALVLALVLYVNGHNTDSPTSTNPAAAVQANHEAEILIAQDQAPRSGQLARGQSPVAGLERSIHARMSAQVKAGSIDGPLHRVRCHPVGARTSARRAFACSVVAGGVTYPFLGVADTAGRRITYCKRDQPPVASDNIPVSGRCRA